MKTVVTAAMLLAVSAGAALAQPAPRMKGRPPVENPLTIGVIFEDATLFLKLVMIILLVAMVAAVIVCVRKLLSGPKLAGGSAFLSGLRAGGPLLGLIGAAYGLMNTSLGVANVGPVPLAVVMPGLVEALLTATLGLVAGFVAIACHWAVEARIDRQVLRS